MSEFGELEEVDSPLFPEYHINRMKAEILTLKKLSELPTSKSYNSSTAEVNATLNLELMVQSPLRKRKIIKPKLTFSKGKRNNKSLLHSNVTIAHEEKVEKKVRPQSSTFTSQLVKRKSINIHQNLFSKTPSKAMYIRPFMPPAGLTAYAYIIMENEHVHISWNSKTMVEIASLTKIMTCYCILNLLRIYNLDRHHMVEVGIVETSMIGTSARLKRNYRYTINQLLYGLMLPSGNDASMALAVWGGRVLAQNSWKPSIVVTKKRQAISLFVEYMNSIGRDLELKKTRFSNPHGLSSPDNKSTAFDMSLLCQRAMENVEFRKIVATKQYSTLVITDRGERQEIVWKNTHKLLKKDCYLGVKTGITDTAGACLSSFITINHRNFVIVVLNCKKLQRRFKQTQILRKWLFKKQLLCKAQKSIDIDLELERQDEMDAEDDKELYNH